MNINEMLLSVSEWQVVCMESLFIPLVVNIIIS